jgi:hypothetical protein
VRKGFFISLGGKKVEENTSSMDIKDGFAVHQAVSALDGKQKIPPLNGGIHDNQIPLLFQLTTNVDSDALGTFRERQTLQSR